MSEFTRERCCDGEFCGAWDTCRDKADRSPAPELPPAEAATVARFDAAPYPAEILREQMAQALNDEMAYCQEYTAADATDGCPDCEDLLRIVDALLAGPLARFTGGNR